MPRRHHDTEAAPPLQLPSLVDDTWATEVVPRLPADFAVQAVHHRAFQRKRGLADPAALLRALLASVLCVPATRHLGAWAVLVGLADLSATAWRKRLHAANAWLFWLLTERRAVPPAPVDPQLPCAGGRVLLVDATRLRRPGGCGDDYRLHTAYDLGGGRLAHLTLTTQRGAECVDHFALASGDIVVADGGYGYRRTIASLAQHAADGVLRIHPHTFPVEDAAGQPVDLVRWLRRRGEPTRRQGAWCCWAGQRYRVRLVAAKLPAAAAAARAARKRKRQKAMERSRPFTAVNHLVAGWVLLVTTLDEAVWDDAAVLRLYRARWQIELVYTRMKPVLRVNQIRSRRQVGAEATVRRRLSAWVLQDGAALRVRGLLPRGLPPAAGGLAAPPVVSSWLLTALCLEPLRQPVRGQWSQRRFAACLPRLARFLWSQPRGRRHQETEVRAWLAGRVLSTGALDQHAA